MRENTACAVVFTAGPRSTRAGRCDFRLKSFPHAEVAPIFSLRANMLNTGSSPQFETDYCQENNTHTFSTIQTTHFHDRIVKNFYINVYDTRGSDMDSCLLTQRKEAYRNSFMYMDGKLWNDLPEFVQNSTNIESFKDNYRMYKRITSS